MVSLQGEKTLTEEIGKYFLLKEGSVGSPTIYLGGQIREVQMENGTFYWICGSSKYVRAAVANVEDYLSKRDEKLPRKAETPLLSNYGPE